jgi:hypothetical protein
MIKKTFLMIDGGRKIYEVGLENSGVREGDYQDLALVMATIYAFIWARG